MLLEEDLQVKAVCIPTIIGLATRIFLTSAKKDKEDLEEISNELELADEDEKIPYDS